MLCFLLGHDWNLIRYLRFSELNIRKRKTETFIKSTNRCKRCGKFHVRKDKI